MGVEATSAEDEQAAVGEDDIFYASQKALLLLKIKLQRGEAVDESLVSTFAYPGDCPDDEVLVPVDLSCLHKDFPGEEVLGGAHLDVERMVEKLGTTGVAEALVNAQKLFLANKEGEPPAERPKPMTAKEWRETWDNEEGEEEEEEALEEGEEELAEGEEEEEPAPKKPKTA
mmetsp:Transcript_88973/g.207068  ORF Transcript_88973/g.207068 Transcript_88973/m.207068 type:complete len:172 (-) Transcript_88973:73-588(-)